jgi:hypothetical protein
VQFPFQISKRQVSRVSAGCERHLGEQVFQHVELDSSFSSQAWDELVVQTSMDNLCHRLIIPFAMTVQHLKTISETFISEPDVLPEQRRSTIPHRHSCDGLVQG